MKKDILLSIRIHYFSGTGNTAYAVNFLQKTFLEKSISVETYFLGRDPLPEEKKIDFHIFAFPVYAWSAPIPFLNYIHGLSVVHYTPCAILSVGGAISSTLPGFGGQAISEVQSLLHQRGYHANITEEIYLPDNWTQFTNPPPLEEVKLIVTQGEKALESFISSILNQEVKQFKVHFFHILWSKFIGFLFRLLGSRALGKLFIADDSCGACGLCVKNCPTKTISLKGTQRKLPQWNFSCIGCNRCINFCPDNAIQMSGGRSAIGLFSFILLGYYLVPLTSFLVELIFRTSSNLQSWLFHLGIGSSLVVLFHLLYFTAIDAGMEKLQQIQPFRSFFLLNWTQHFRRFKYHKSWIKH